MAPKRQQKHKKTLPFGQQGETHRVSLTRFQQGEDDTGTGYHTTPYQIAAMSNVAPPSEMSEPSYDDADWFPVRENISDKTNIDRCNSMTSSQNSTVNDAGYDQENVSPNAQQSAASRPLNLINTTEQDHTSQQPTMATIAKPTATKSTPATKTFKSAAKTKATTATEPKGVDNAMCYKRKGFGSVYTEASKKRQAFNEKKT
ncbi:hypothetical protein GN958_ATG01288 [Phytophthora infestans]|uniref:Uncharacterized protein n=1 Tax=Phytophthora infestans TaxID=4787 RepID=A0A8S9V904_PHYIN|nr:hypothetical protein GN958_ATG01288 [Phytophthora infestans]